MAGSTNVRCLVSYAVKRKLQKGAPFVVVKRRFPPDESFEAMVSAMKAQLHEDRFGGPKYVDHELGLLMKFPGSSAVSP